MWLPSNEPEKVIKGKLKKSEIPTLGYLRVLEKGNESVLFIKDEKIVGSWYLDINTLAEYYEAKAMELLTIKDGSKIEIYNMGSKLFETIVELNEESKLSLPVGIEFIVEKIGSNTPVDRNELLLKYGIRDPSSNDLDVIINQYKIGE